MKKPASLFVYNQNPIAAVLDMMYIFTEKAVLEGK